MCKVVSHCQAKGLSPVAPGVLTQISKGIAGDMEGVPRHLHAEFVAGRLASPSYSHYFAPAKAAAAPSAPSALTGGLTPANVSAIKQALAAKYARPVPATDPGLTAAVQYFGRS